MSYWINQIENAPSESGNVRTTGLDLVLRDRTSNMRKACIIVMSKQLTLNRPTDLCNRCV